MVTKKSRKKNLNVVLPCFILFVFLFSSCASQRKLEYLQQPSSFEKEYPNAGLQDYKLKPKDELYVQISSLDEATATISASASSSRETSGMSPYGASLMAHSIDNEGYVILPVIGKILVKDKTLAQVTSLIQESLVGVLSHPDVTVKLVNAYISILGEVKTPGHFVYSEDKLSVFDALGLAGDITEFGNRKYVILVRNENGKNVRRELNLLKSDILTSDYYYLRPGDILYIKPRKSKFWGFNQFPFSTLLTAITTTIVVLQYQKTFYK